MGEASRGSNSLRNLNAQEKCIDIVAENTFDVCPILPNGIEYEAKRSQRITVQVNTFELGLHRP
jgi:hypothetical protein